ncbi:hypothetical protein [Streptomyces sp. NPDC047315]|uniref:hypothetical protein n=1 Tax=Streptomyces sp. NPDC047315 TaxID=3155142 RepID=UPI0034046A36
MDLRFIGIDPETDEDGCPTVWVDHAAEDLLIQSYTADSETAEKCHSLSPAKAPIPPGETVIRFPRRMVPLIRKACDELDELD